MLEAIGARLVLDIVIPARDEAATLGVTDRVPRGSLIASVKRGVPGGCSLIASVKRGVPGGCGDADAAGFRGSLRGRCVSAAGWRSEPDGSKWCARSRAAFPGAISSAPCAPAGGISWRRRLTARAGSDWIGHAGARSSKDVPVRHMAWRMTASLRASATLALRGPVRLAIASAQSRRAEPPILRVMMALAAS